MQNRLQPLLDMMTTRDWALIGCKVFEHILINSLPQEDIDRVTILEYGLHRVPDKLRETIQKLLDQIHHPSRVLLAYGLCGNGLHGVQAGKHTLMIPRAHDCITIFLGSRERYQSEFQSCPGTYYLTRGWLESGSDPLREFLEYREQYGEEEAQWIMDQQYSNYERVVLVGSSQEELDNYRARAQEVARYCERWGMRYEERLGSNTYIQKLLEVVEGPASVDQAFLIIPPGEEIRMEAFLDDEFIDDAVGSQPR